MLLFWWCAVAGLTVVYGNRAHQERVVANLFVTDQPDYPGPLNTKAGQPFVNNFLLTDYDSNATIATELGYCVPVRTPGPAQCLYTLSFAQGTLQVCKVLLEYGIHLHILVWHGLFVFAASGALCYEIKQRAIFA